MISQIQSVLPALRVRRRCLALPGLALLLAVLTFPGWVAAQAGAPAIRLGSSIRVSEPGDVGWARVVLELAVTVEEEDENEEEDVTPPDFCFPYRLNLDRGTASSVDVRLAGGGSSGAFVVVADNQRFAATSDLELAGDDVVEGDETFYLDVYEAQSGRTTCSVSGAVIARVEVVIEDDDSDTSGISPTAFTVRETDVDAAAALELTFEQAADADYCFAFELAYGRSTAGAADAWVGSRGVSSGSFLLRAGLTEVVVRDLIIAGDDEVEETEVLYIDVYQRQRASTCSASGSVVTVLRVTIEDDDADTSGISPTEFTVRETDVDAAAALALTFEQAADADYCFAFELAYGRSTAGAADAWVGSRKLARGSFVLRSGLTEVVLRDLIIAGDDEVEGPETLYIDVYERQRASTCSASGSVVTVLTVTIEDDDSDASGISPIEFTVTETDADAPAALELTFAQAADADYCFAFELAYGRSTAGAADAWVGPGRSASGSFILSAGLTDIVVRDVVIAGDDEVEGSETLHIDVYQRQRASACSAGGSVVAVLTVTIEDDDTDAPDLDGALEVIETDADAVALLVLSLDDAADEARCYPYRIAYSRSTAGRDDARLVRTGGFAPADFGTFVVAAAFDGGRLVEPDGRRRRHHRGRRDPVSGHLCAGSGRGGVVLSVGHAGSHHRRRHRGRRSPGRDRLAPGRRRRRGSPPGGGHSGERESRARDRHVRPAADRAGHAALRLGGRRRGPRNAAEAGRRDRTGALGDGRRGSRRGPTCG